MFFLAIPLVIINDMVSFHHTLFYSIVFFTLYAFFPFILYSVHCNILSPFMYFFCLSLHPSFLSSFLFTIFVQSLLSHHQLTPFPLFIIHFLPSLHAYLFSCLFILLHPRFVFSLSPFPSSSYTCHYELYCSVSLSLAFISLLYISFSTFSTLPLLVFFCTVRWSHTFVYSPSLPFCYSVPAAPLHGPKIQHL